MTGSRTFSRGSAAVRSSLDSFVISIRRVYCSEDGSPYCGRDDRTVAIYLVRIRVGESKIDVFDRVLKIQGPLGKIMSQCCCKR